MSEAAAPDVFRKLELAPADERAAGRLRLGAAVLSLVGAIWIALLSPSTRMWIWVVLGVLAAAMWVALYARGRRRAGSARDHFLSLESSGLRVVSPKSEEHVEWLTVVGVEADEEHLVVLVSRVDGSTVSLEPLYDGLGMYELEAVVRRAWRTATPGPRTEGDV